LNQQVQEKCTLILQKERSKLKHQFSNITGFVDVMQLNKSIPIQLRKIIEDDSGIKPLLSDIESLILKQCKGDP
jgi:hypothetical protein